MSQNYYRKKIDEIVKEFDTDLKQGLSQSVLAKKKSMVQIN